MQPQSPTQSENGIEVAFQVKNTGDRAGAEVVQVYVGSDGAEEDRPIKLLRGYERIELQPGEEKNARTSSMRRIYDSTTRKPKPGRWIPLIMSTLEPAAVFFHKNRKIAVRIHPLAGNTGFASTEKLLFFKTKKEPKHLIFSGFTRFASIVSWLDVKVRHYRCKPIASRNSVTANYAFAFFKISR